MAPRSGVEKRDHVGTCMPQNLRAGRERLRGVAGGVQVTAAKGGVSSPSGELALGLFVGDTAVLGQARHCCSQTFQKFCCSHERPHGYTT